MNNALEAIQSIHPQLTGVALMLAVWGALWGARRWAPGVWRAVAVWGPPGSPVSHVVQAAPAAVLGAVAGAIMQGGDPLGALHGALWAVGAPLLHHAAKVMPGPYRGALGGKSNG